MSDRPTATPLRPGVADRILTITGTIEQVLRAVALVATALSEDEGYAALAARPSTYSSHAMASVQAGMVRRRCRLITSG